MKRKFQIQVTVEVDTFDFGLATERPEVIYALTQLVIGSLTDQYHVTQVSTKELGGKRKK